MPFDDLSRFLQAASDAGEMERISIPMQVDQEIAALTQQICREFQAASPAILFELPGSSSIPVVTNVLGNQARFFRALGAENFQEVVARLQSALHPLPANRDWKFGFSAGAGDRSRFASRTIRRGLCQQIIKLGNDVDLWELPVLRSWPGESAPVMTSAVVVTENREGRPSLERIPLEVVDARTLQLHWNVGGPCYQNWLDRREQDRSLSVAVFLGGDPLLTYLAGLPVPGWFDPWFLAGILRNESLNLIRARTVELNVPAEAEFVIEGEIEPSDPQGTGTVAGPTGLLQTSENLPRLSVTAMTHRANPIFPARVCAFDCNEDFVCSRLTEQLLLGVLQLTHPAARDLHLPACGGHREAVFVSTSAASPLEVQQLLHAVRALPMLSEAAMIVAVGPEVNVRDSEAVWREVSVALATSGTNRPVNAVGDGSPLILDATGLHRRGPSVIRCQPGREVLSALAQKFGTSSEVVSESSTPPSHVSPAGRTSS